MATGDMMKKYRWSHHTPLRHPSYVPAFARRTHRLSLKLMSTGPYGIAKLMWHRMLFRFTRCFGTVGIHVQWWLDPGPNSLDSSTSFVDISSKFALPCYFLLNFLPGMMLLSCCAGRTASAFPNFELDGTRDANSVVFSPDGSTLYIATDNWAVCATNSTGESEPEWCEPAQDSNLCDISISPDGLSVTTGRMYPSAFYLLLEGSWIRIYLRDGGIAMVAKYCLVYSPIRRGDNTL